MSLEKTILLIEDRADDVELTIRAFKNNSIPNKIIVARDGVEALDFLLGKREDNMEMPSLIILDLKLPKMHGCEILRQIRENEKTGNIPIVILTSSSEESDIQECYTLHANSYIVKPVEFSKFNQTIRHIGTYWLEINETPLRDTRKFANGKKTL